MINNLKLMLVVYRIKYDFNVYDKLILDVNFFYLFPLYRTVSHFSMIKHYFRSVNVLLSLLLKIYKFKFQSSSLYFIPYTFCL